MTALLLVLALSSLTAAETLSLEEARQLALQNNNEYQAQVKSVEAAKWSKSQALSSFLPSLSLSGTWLYMDPAATYQAGAQTVELNNDMRTISLSLSQPLFTGGKIWQAYQMSKISLEMAELGMQNQRLTLLAEVDNRYLALLQTKALVELSQLDEQSAARNLEIAQLKFDSSLISKGELLKFQSRLASKEVSLLQAESALQLAQLNLRNYLGLDYLPVPEAIADPENDPELALLDKYDVAQTNLLIREAIRRGKSSSVALQISERTVDLSKRAYSISKGSFLPSVILTGSRKYEENGIDRWEFTPSNQLMLNVSIPLLPQLGNYAALRKSRAEYERAILTSESATDGIQLGTEAAVLNLVNAAKQVRAAKLALDYTRQSYEQLQQRYILNMISSTELLDAELMLSSASLAHSNSVYNYLKARAALMQLLNLEQPQDLETMITKGVDQ